MDRRQIRWVPNIGAVIPLCFNNLAWFTYGEDPLCRTSRTTKYLYTWHFRVKFAPGRPQNWVFYVSFPDESTLDRLGRKAESAWQVRRGLSGRLVIDRSGSILRGPWRRTRSEEHTSE